MKNYKINRSIFLAFCIAVIALSACKKTGLGVEDSVPDRLFRPTISSSLVADGNWVTASWEKIKGADSYSAQISVDSFKTITRTIIIKDTNIVTFDSLKWSQLYQVQIRANALDTIKNSKFGNLGSIKTPKFPTIMNTPSISDVTDEALKVSWVTGGAAVTSVKVLKGSDSSLVKTVTLTNTDITNQYAIVSGLASGSSYIVYLYSGTSVRGWDNFRTASPLAGNIVDLRGITGRPSVLSDTIPLIPAGSTVLLKRSEVYNISAALNLSNSITIISGSDLTVTNQALIYFTSNFNFTAGSAIDYIDFRDVTLRSDSYGSRYLFNTTASATVGRISLVNCKAEIFRGLVRLQSGTVALTNYVITNCIIDSIKDYGVLTVGVATAKVDNIAITNSTFYKVNKLIASSAAGSTSSSVLIQNCTFNETPLGGGATLLIDYNTNNVTSGIVINKCIMGIAQSGGTSMQVKGVRYATSSSADGGGSYGTSDYLVSGNAILNIATYAKLYTDLFTDPLNGNFKLKDKTFGGFGVAGDPRWW